MISNLSSFASALAGIVAITGLYAAFLRARKSHVIRPKSLEEMMEIGAEKAVGRAHSRYEVTLDFTPASLLGVDAVLLRIHREFTVAPRLVDVNSLAFVFGSYVGETIRRNHTDCAWERNHVEGGENSYPLHWGQGTSFPIGWCIRCIRNGEEESVWMNYERAKDMSEGQPDVKHRTATAS
ncbi:hypothetical protein Acid345_2690 [Candidatus Koribacter versatilis Ellin345]|uniref:Uncharacterized protein n=1 Tax=Koribacter versatilis (strain Ellin345) TaxID=204669 RepID=Q1IN59_KORVE|nr:hypothetical protein [Candidatus Koribacter versatilis]ABF41691.1 hypothetical protein Acid345_2690 [Candidatus Koribacter versatilis Ellin345]